MGKIEGKSIIKTLTSLIKSVTGFLTAIPAFLTAIPVFLSAFTGFIAYISNSSISAAGFNKFILENKTFLLITVFMLSLLLFIALIIILIKYKNIQFYGDKNQGPKYRDINKLLKGIAKKKLNLLVVGRTNFFWFDNFDKKKDLYKKALDNDCKFQFIIQHKDVKNNNLNDATKKTIEKHIPQTIENYLELYKYLELKVKNIKDNFKLSFTKIPVNNSMVALYDNKNNYPYFSYDIGQNIDNDQNIVSGQNPYLVFYNNSIIPEIKSELENIRNKSTDYNRIYVLDKNIDDLLKSHSLYSFQRENLNKKMMYHYFKRENCMKTNGFYPPVSIQFLITSNCTAECVMCGHHSINAKNELSKNEIMNVIDYIHDIGTKNIVISGGEPLSRCDCIGILEYAKKKELNVGLFTNGVKKNGESITLCEAGRIKKYCDWVQLSIDSFKDGTYKQIRNIDLSIVRESLENLEAVGVNLDIVFTIQKSNIDEAVEMVKTGKTAFGFRSKVRFKFAHGPDKNNNFLLSGLHDKLDEFLKYSGKDVNFYSKYFNEMIAEDFFTKDDIIRGVPVYSLNRTFKKSGYICHAINYTCVIDAEGNVYPCCFLYDDNVGDNSKIRNKHYSGTLRSNGIITSLSEGVNKLKQVLSENYNRYINYKIPFDEEACNYCTRHFYQNAFLNELHETVTEYVKNDKDSNFSDFYSNEDISNYKMWF
jgi:MoaA/NifB/PqqE/SkfB family radical SAM enzyme